MVTIFHVFMILFNVLWWIIVVQAIMSWLIAFNVINTYNEAVRQIWTTLQKLTEPIYRPIRKLMPDLGGLDLSPIVVLILMQILAVILQDILLR